VYHDKAPTRTGKTNSCHPLSNTQYQKHLQDQQHFIDLRQGACLKLLLKFLKFARFEELKTAIKTGSAVEDKRRKSHPTFFRHSDDDLMDALASGYLRMWQPCFWLLLLRCCLLSSMG
jgi:hypothetical protein